MRFHKIFSLAINSAHLLTLKTFKLCFFDSLDSILVIFYKVLEKFDKINCFLYKQCKYVFTLIVNNILCRSVSYIFRVWAD